VIRWHLAQTYHLPHVGSTQLFSKLSSMRAISFIRVHKAPFAIIKCRKEHWLYFKVGIILEYILCCKWVIIVAHSCMISCLFGPSIPHICVECSKHHHLLWIIAVYQRNIGRKNQFIFKVALFLFANEWIDKKTIVEIKSCLLQHFVGNMRYVSCLETHY